MSDATADAIARLRQARELWIELDDPPRRAVRLLLPGWADSLRLAHVPALELLQDVLGRVDAWRGFTWSDAGDDQDAPDAPMPFDPALWQALLDLNDLWVDRCVRAFTAARQARAERAETVAGN